MTTRQYLRQLTKEQRRATELEQQLTECKAHVRLVGNRRDELQLQVTQLENALHQRRDVTAERDALRKTVQDLRAQHSQALKDWAFQRTEETTRLQKQVILYERFFTILQQVTDRAR